MIKSRASALYCPWARGPCPELSETLRRGEFRARSCRQTLAAILAGEPCPWADGLKPKLIRRLSVLVEVADTVHPAACSLDHQLPRPDRADRRSTSMPSARPSFCTMPMPASCSRERLHGEGRGRDQDSRRMSASPARYFGFGCRPKNNRLMHTMTHALMRRSNPAHRIIAHPQHYCASPLRNRADQGHRRHPGAETSARARFYRGEDMALLQGDQPSCRECPRARRKMKERPRRGAARRAGASADHRGDLDRACTSIPLLTRIVGGGHPAAQRPERSTLFVL